VVCDKEREFPGKFCLPELPGVLGVNSAGSSQVFYRIHHVHIPQIHTTKGKSLPHKNFSDAERVSASSNNLYVQ